MIKTALPSTLMLRSLERGLSDGRKAKYPNAPTRFAKAPERRVVRSWVLGLLVLTFLISTSPAFAESRASVKVNNNVSGSSTANMESYTNITVETDGNTTRYTTNEPGSVEVNSVNGVTEIKKDGSVVTENESNNPTSGPTASPTAKPTQAPGGDGKNNQNKNIFQVFEDLFKKIFSLLS